MHALARQIETERQKARNHLPGDGHTTILSPPFSSQDLGHARTRARREFFKPPGPGREPRSTTWESSNTAITLTAGPQKGFLYDN